MKTTFDNWKRHYEENHNEEIGTKIKCVTNRLANEIRNKDIKI